MIHVTSAREIEAAQDGSPVSRPASRNVPPGRQTPLQQQLDALDEPPRASPLEALATARQWFNQGRRIDIQGLAAELGISRVTLHRWVGTREQLLTEVLWASTDRALTRLQHAVAAEELASSHTAEVLTRWAAAVLEHPGVRRLQADEGDKLARLLTSTASDFQRRLVERVELLLGEDITAGRIAIALDPDVLAYTTVRILESFIHTPVITGGAPDPDSNAHVLRALLR